MSVEDNKALVRRYFDEVFNKGNVDELDVLFADGYHGRIGTTDLDRAAIKQAATQARASNTTFHVTIHDLLADGDKVVARWSTPPVSANGAPAQFGRHMITIFQITGGRVVETWAEFSNPGD